MDLQEVVRVLNSGGWALVSGFRVDELGRGSVTATLEDKELVLSRGDSQLRLPLDRVKVGRHYGRPHLSSLTLLTPRLVREQRKKSDGGGWHEVERWHAAFGFSNEDLAQKNKIHQEEQIRLAQQKREAELQSRRQAHADRIERFFKEQLVCIGDATVKKMSCGDGAAFVIEFSNGHKLFLDSFGLGDGYCAELRIAGSDTFDPNTQHLDEELDLVAEY